VANNRMMLYHRPSRRGFVIAKRMGFGWYTKMDADEFNAFLRFCERHSNDDDQDDFALLHESDDNWRYVDTDEHGYWKIKFNDKEFRDGT